MKFGKNINPPMKLTVDSFFFYLLCLFPLFLVSGPFLADLTLIVLSIYFLIKVVLEKKWNLLNNNFFLFFFIFYLYLLFNSIFNSGLFMSIQSSVTYIRFGLFIMAISYILKNNQRKISIIFYCYISIFLVLAIDSIFQKYFGTNIIGIQQYDSIRVSSFFRDKLILGGFIMKMIPIIYILLFCSDLKKNKYLILIPIIGIVPIILSAEKSALALYILFLVFHIFGYKTRLVYKILIFFISFLIILTLLIYNPLVKQRVFDQALSNSGNGKYIFSRMHHSHFVTAFNMFVDKPFFGQGPNTFRIKCSEKKFMHDEFACSTHPHNYYFQLLGESGLVGFLFLFLFFLYVFVKLTKKLFLIIKKIKIDYSVYYSLVGLFLSFIPISSTGNFFNNWTASLYSLLIGFFIFSVRKFKY